MVLYDQCSGHTKIKVLSLIPSNTNVSIVGVAITIYDANILEFGPYTAPLKVGCTQSMIFVNVSL